MFTNNNITVTQHIRFEPFENLGSPTAFLKYSKCLQFCC